MLLQTPVHIAPASFMLKHDDGVVSLGSCFAEEVGARLRRDGFRVDNGPCGTLYNPASIAAALRLLLSGEMITKDQLVQHEGLFHSMMHHGAFSAPTAEEVLHNCNEALDSSRKALQEASTIILTFGTAWVYEQKGGVVANCHKLPAQCFTRRRLSVLEIVADYQGLFDMPELCEKRIIYTVSPIRHKKDGLHENQLSKSTLLLAVEELVHRQEGKALYFPSYELVLDELRDYRFFAEDMCHPTPQAADYVYERFSETFFSKATQEAALVARHYHQECQHRPLHLNEDGLREREKELAKKRNEILQKYPTLAL